LAVIHGKNSVSGSNKKITFDRFGAAKSKNSAINSEIDFGLYIILCSNFVQNSG
jgi:hypothetical protein